ncbi:MAG: MATE family efflux transporter [Eubacteriales bacterium]|nr:MATE family efflux transporter [Eubacteriales bacterium]
MKMKMSWKDFLKVMVTIALPIAFQNLLSTTASMVDTIMIGSQGELSVAAVGICAQIGSLFFSAYWGFASASILFFSQFWGAQDEKGINKTFGISFIFMCLVGFSFAALCVMNPTFMLSIYTDKTAIIQAGEPYIRIIGLAYPMQAFGVLVSFLLRSTERIKAPLICSIVSLIVNFCLNFVLIYGRFGVPKMGISGAAVGTLVSGVVNLVLLVIYLLRSKSSLRLHISQLFHIDGTFFKTYLTKAFPILCNEFFYGTGQMLINIVIGHQDESAIAAMAAFRVCEGFVFAFFGGLSNATSVVVGQNVGSGEHKDAYQFVKRSALFCPMVTFTIVLICTVLHHPLLGLFGLGETAIMYGKYMLLIYLFLGSIRTCNYIMNESYRAAGESVFGTVVETLGLFLISVPATWIAGMVLHLPFLAVFAFVYTDELIRLVIELKYTHSGKWIKPVTKEGKQTLSEFRKLLNEKA